MMPTSLDITDDKLIIFDLNAARKRLSGLPLFEWGKTWGRYLAHRTKLYFFTFEHRN